MKPWLEPLQQLRNLLDTRPDLRTALEAAVRKAGCADVKDLDGYFRFLGDVLTAIPRQREMDAATLQFHYIINCSPGGLLLNDEAFQQWQASFSRAYGKFLDSPESAAALESFINDPAFNISDYHPGASGWLTFNQFFSRQVRPGRRPIAEPYNDSVVVAATDSVYLGCRPIDEGAGLTIKGTPWSIAELLDNSPFSEAFTGGVFTHSYLSPTDYHHYHLPVSGVIQEARTIPGRVVVKTEPDEAGKPTAQDGIGFQMKQTRGIVIVDSPLGLVAAIPVGMGFVSSVTLVVERGDRLTKGQDFGYFAYGGSDMVLLFQKGKVEFTAFKGKHYPQGAAIGRATT